MNIYKMKSRIAGETRTAKEIYEDEQIKLAQVVKGDIAEYFNITLDEAEKISDRLQRYDLDIDDLMLEECNCYSDLILEIELCRG